ncbi:glycosyltransferase family 2 protein [Rubellicoccus peritrichatus]|uniref:Glycosyltransferase family 2 protein n=1 Tax=Rubellicoccus peritrichatus TaxID=3080537 RepID=A0AAQ3LA86_9BACT|nr:glycosyltransferase family 2 protein [Puniceicoccus sp. CR14]WOO40809.1 glycosyltransferase family 2 protein [Puniceicoccus sp. CR14]
MNDSSSTPIVSVLMPVYNAEHYLKEAVESILAQTYKNFEFVIVDDGSTDRSLEVLNDFAKNDSRIKIISRPNTGIVGALNDGLKNCSGKYTARMDADDIAHIQRLEKQSNYLENNEDTIAVGSRVRMVDSEGDFIWDYQPPINNNEILEQLSTGNGGALIHPAAMFRSKALMTVNGYKEKWCHIEDLDLYLRLSELGAFHNLSDALLDYRQHFTSANATKAREQADLIAQRLAEEAVTNATSALRTKPTSQLDIRLQWTRWAIDIHNYAGFRKHARGILKTAPFSKHSCALLSMTIAHIFHRLTRLVTRGSSHQ